MELVDDVKGKKLESYGNMTIYKSTPINRYALKKPPFSEKENALAEQLILVLRRKITYGEMGRKMASTIPIDFANLVRDKIVRKAETYNLFDTIPKKDVEEEIKTDLISLVKKYVNFVKDAKAFSDRVYDFSLGFGLLAELVRDDFLEEIMVNGYNHHVFIFHRKYGMCKTNIIAKESGFLDKLISKISAAAGKKLTTQTPLLDARLPDGSRANATAAYVTPFGPTLTIRKFRKIPYSVIDLIKNGTFSPEVTAFFWVMIDGMNISPMNLIVAGGSGTGKTTALNSLSSFIRWRERIVSIEDALELHFGDRENWIQMESKPATKEFPEVTMDELLKNALRMRPDRIVLGEVRGQEAQTLFVAMDTGHDGCLGTLHANNARETTIRLKAPPMSVPESLLPLLNLIVVMEKRHTKDRGMIRRVSQVAEVARMDEKILLANIFEWDPVKDKIARTKTPSKIIETTAQRAGLTKKQLIEEIYVRQRILEWMLENKVRSVEDVGAVIQEYYRTPEKVLETVSK